jgi:hypothetical protein
MHELEADDLDRTSSCVMEYRSRLPVGSGMGLTTPQSTLMLSPRLQNRLNNYLNHLGSNLASKALPGDEFVAEDVFSLYIASIRMRKLTVMRSEDRGVAGGAPDPRNLNRAALVPRVVG